MFPKRNRHTGTRIRPRPCRLPSLPQGQFSPTIAFSSRFQWNLMGDGAVLPAQPLPRLNQVSNYVVIIVGLRPSYQPRLEEKVNCPPLLARLPSVLILKKYTVASQNSLHCSKHQASLFVPGSCKRARLGAGYFSLPPKRFWLPF